MSPSAIAMMIFGLLITWGGASICLFLALKKNSKDENRK